MELNHPTIGTVKLTDLIKGNYCYFDSYRAGFLYYILDDLTIRGTNSEKFEGKKEHEVPEYVADRFLKLTQFRFAIPLDDVGNGTLNNKEKAVTLMRWIRKAFESGELITI